MYLALIAQLRDSSPYASLLGRLFRSGAASGH